MKLCLLIPTLAFPILATLACGQVQEQPTTGSVPTATATVTAPPVVPTTEPTTPPVDPPPAGKIAFPQAFNSGGKIIKTPKVIPVVFQGDPNAAKIAEFHEKLAVSKYWTDVAGEYGIGAITPIPMVTLEEAPPADTSDDEIQLWLKNKLENGTLLGAPDSDTMYALYYPAGTSISLGQGDVSCQSFGGYHNETVAGGIPVAYGVMPFCGGGGGASPIDNLTITASHEVFEWATDPFPFSDPAYQSMQKDFRPWEWAFLGELGDLCTGLDWGGRLKPAELGFRVQRMWSNKSAAAGHNPCIPVPVDPYFVAVPMVKDTVSVQGMSTKGVAVKVGETVELPIQFHSDDPTEPPWDIQVRDSGEVTGQSFSNGSIQFELAKDSGKHGEVTTVKITSKSADMSLFLVIASRGNEAHAWPGIVVAKK